MRCPAQRCCRVTKGFGTLTRPEPGGLYRMSEIRRPVVLASVRTQCRSRELSLGIRGVPPDGRTNLLFTMSVSAGRAGCPAAELGARPSHPEGQELGSLIRTANSASTWSPPLRSSSPKGGSARAARG